MTLYSIKNLQSFMLISENYTRNKSNKITSNKTSWKNDNSKETKKSNACLI